jgi:cardiolipin synthase
MIRKLAIFFKETFSGKWLCISNILTICRIALTPLITYELLTRQWGLALFFFIIAGFSDVLDGYLARRLNQQTPLGVYLDPIADKILILSSFWAILSIKSRFPLPIWFVKFALVRELVIVIGAIYLLVFKEIKSIQPTIWGKLTTMFQILFIVWLITCLIAGWNPQKTYSAALLLLLTFSCFSLMDYIKRGVRHLKG